MYKRKTKDVYVVQGYYGKEWSDLYITESYQDAYSNYVWFSTNEYGYMHQIIVRRERLHESNN